MKGLYQHDVVKIMVVGHMRIGVVVLLTALTLSGLSAGSSALADAKSKKDAKPLVISPSVPDQPPSKSARPQAAKPSGKAAPNLSAERQNKKSPEQNFRKARRQKHVGKKACPQASVRVKPDLSYHGMLKQPQRYDPSPSRRKGGAPNPQAGDLLHDHFQELDKNRDGMIDPFERALGRLDIDRDLANRLWD